jgi:hypothetical protein
MTVPVERPPAVDDPPPATEQPATEQPAAEHLGTGQHAAGKSGIEDRSWLLFAVVLGFIVLAFAGMFLLTALGGGSDYLPWSP